MVVITTMWKTGRRVDKDLDAGGSESSLFGRTCVCCLTIENATPGNGMQPIEWPFLYFARVLRVCWASPTGTPLQSEHCMKHRYAFSSTITTTTLGCIGRSLLLLQHIRNSMLEGNDTIVARVRDESE
jgi:hypothetical protein